MFNHLDWFLRNAIKRLPFLAESECETLITGADSYSPDGRLIMNESAEVSLSISISMIMMIDPWIYLD